MEIDYLLVSSGITKVFIKCMLNKNNTVNWKLVLLDILSSGLTLPALASRTGIQRNSLDRLIDDQEAQPSFVNGCIILTYFNKYTTI